jgi:hypothetical protein
MTTLPTWALYATALGSPALTFVGVIIMQRTVRKGAKEQRQGAVELETRSQREEAGRNLRWACEQVASDNPELKDTGVAVIWSLLQEKRLSHEDMRVARTVATVFLGPVLEELGAGPAAGEIYRVEGGEEL